MILENRQVLGDLEWIIILPTTDIIYRCQQGKWNLIEQGAFEMID